MTLGPASRVALYWTPDRADPLAVAGNAWLGRDPELGVPVGQPELPGIEEFTADARLYGFHATLRPPMRLATGWDEFITAADGVASRTAEFDLPPLRVSVLDGFLALCLSAPSRKLHDLADACVRATDAHRLRPDAAELAKRRKGGLSVDQERLLLEWGYPHVMEHWRFHMTLSRRLTEGEVAVVLPAARRHFAPALSVQRRVCEVAVFTQAAACDAAQPFLIGNRLALSGGPSPTSCPV